MYVTIVRAKGIQGRQENGTIQRKDEGREERMKSCCPQSEDEMRSRSVPTCSNLLRLAGREILYKPTLLLLSVSFFLPLFFAPPFLSAFCF